MLPCTVIHFFLNNQLDALIIQIYSVIKLSMFRAILCPSSEVFYCTFGTGKFHAGFFDDIFQQSQDGTALQFHPDSACRRYSRKLLLMGKEDARNMESFTTE
jgi:hypothetical protein